MTWAGLPARRWPQAVARTATLVAVLAASSFAAGGAAAAGPQAAQALLTYACRFPAGQLPITATVGAAFPASGIVGRPIQPTHAALSLTLPPSVVSYLATLHAGAVTASARLTVEVRVHGTSVASQWQKLAAPRIPVPARGGLVLNASGPVPAVTVQAPGSATFTPAGLLLVLTVTTGSTTRGPPTVPASMRLACSPATGQQPTLVSVPVTGARPLPAPSSAPPPTAPKHHFCPSQPKGGLKLNPRFPLPKHPPGAKRIHAPPEPACAYVVGYSDTRKLKGAALVGPGLTDLSVAVKEFAKFSSPSYFEEDSAGQLDFKACGTCKTVHGLPPAKATFLGFGFIPVTATIHLMEVGTINIISVGTIRKLITNTVWSDVTLRISGVTVNGTPLNVGPHCRAAGLILLKLSGNPTGIPPYSIQGGGPLTGDIKIPPFTGCGVSENLNPLFTESISGPRNFVLLTQGPPCFILGGGFGCPPKKPKPLRKVG